MIFIWLQWQCFPWWSQNLVCVCFICFYYSRISLAIPYNSIGAQKISDVWIPALSKGEKCYQAKSLWQKFKKKAKFDKWFDFEKTGNTFYSFVYVHKEREYKHLKFFVHLYYCRESLTQLLSSAFLFNSNIELVKYFKIFFIQKDEVCSLNQFLAML